jgi:hypothetical protein
VDVLVVVVVVAVVVEGDFDLVAGRMRFVEGRACTRPWPIFDPNKHREREREGIQFPIQDSLGSVVETDQNSRT